MKKIISGTKEWAVKNYNILSGCSHDCKYCYAKSMAIRFKRKTADTWKEEELLQEACSKKVGKAKGQVMYPSSHDITPKHLYRHTDFIHKLIIAGNDILIVSKPHFECIKEICECIKEICDIDNSYKNKEKILFRFTIGSANNSVLKLWEPGAPSFEERLKSLKYAFDNGFKTSVSCEPMLDNHIDEVVDQVYPYVTDAIWLGNLNQAKARLNFNGCSEEMKESMEQLLEWQNEERTKNLYNRYRKNSKIKYKESIKKIVGLDTADASGLDI